MNQVRPQAPLIVQGDRTITVEVYHPRYEEIRDQLNRFAELVKSPEHLHTYRMTPVSIWNAAALGESASAIREFLLKESRYPVAPAVLDEMESWLGRYGLLRLERVDGTLQLACDDSAVLQEVLKFHDVADLVGESSNGPASVTVPEDHRGLVKQALIALEYPVEDLAGYREGAPLSFALRTETAGRAPFTVRPYQADATSAFHRDGGPVGGNGVVVLPCGAGKTIVGMSVMEKLQTRTLILTTNQVAVGQWRAELLDKTTLQPDQVGTYTAEHKTVCPVTITTYQMMTWRRSREGEFEHMALFNEHDWGLIIYDEVHLLPAPVFRATADIQARRRLGLTATLVREDEKEDEVFCLIGPKRADIPWKVLESQGWIASVRCVEVRVPFSGELKRVYAASQNRQRFRLASENEAKDDAVERLVALHEDDQILVIGQYLDQLRRLRDRLDVPMISGRTPNEERERLYKEFRERRVNTLIVSKVGNFAVDLPDANVAIQVSGTYGSRQEEAQRLGRILRPKEDGAGATFYTLVTEDSREGSFAQKRQRFLTEQGYAYEIRSERPE